MLSLLLLLPAAGPPGNPAVDVAAPIKRTVYDEVSFNGRIKPGTSVDVRPRVGGHIDKVLVKAGEAVKAGQPLFLLDDRLAKAEFSKFEAFVAKAEARMARAKADAERVERLAKGAVVSKEEVDRAKTVLDEAAADLKVATADLRAAKLRLDWCHVRAGIAGRVGRLRVSPGDVVKADEMSLTTVEAVGPKRVAFDVDERTFLQVFRPQAGRGGSKVSVSVGGKALDGEITYVADRLTEPTGAAAMEATVADAEERLLPGMHARVTVRTHAGHEVLVSPVAVSSHSGMGSSGGILLVVDADGRLQSRSVTVYTTAKYRYENQITSGLKPGDYVLVPQPNTLLKSKWRVIPLLVPHPAE